MRVYCLLHLMVGYAIAQFSTQNNLREAVRSENDPYEGSQTSTQVSLPRAVWQNAAYLSGVLGCSIF